MNAASPPVDFPGLTEEEAAARLARHGPNRLSVARLRPAWRIVLDALREPMFVLLLAAVALYFTLGELAESAFLLASALATIGLVVVQEARSERALAALRALAEPAARVIRGGAERSIPAAELVPGDIVLVGEGARIPADAVLLSGDVLSVDESVLTGESAPVLHAPGEGEAAALFAGTLIVRGQGVARVTRTGPETRIGGIGASLSSLQEEPTPLQHATRRLIRELGLAALAAAASVAILHGLLRQDWIGGAQAGLTLGIALIPEEFPMALAVFLALGGWRLAQKKVLVRRAAAIEALGAISVLCVDKTGTLTHNRMRVAGLWRDGQGWRPTRGAARPTPEMGELLTAAAMASAVHALDPMDRAVREAAGDVATPPGLPLRSSPLRPDRLAFVQAWADGQGGLVVAAKGAPEAIFGLCGLSADARARVEPVVEDFARQGLRVLGVASARCPQDHGCEPGGEAFAFEGLVAFDDPVRDDVPPALAAARAAGLAVVVITGDYPQTALAIARQAGLDTEAGALSGAQVAAMSDAELRAQVSRVRVFARIAPEQKLRLVEALKGAGERVGMFGDGVNDAPALEAADVGVAMGKRGTDVAREAADLVLLDDRFPSIVAGVAEGRRIFANLRAALVYLVVAHVPIAGLALLPVLVGLGPILLPMQVVLLELVIDPMCAMVFEGRPSDRAAMKQPPRSADEPLFGLRRLAVALGQGVVLLAAIFGMHLVLLDQGVTEAVARAASLICLVAANLAVAAVLGSAGGAWDRRQQMIYGAIAAFASLMLAAGVAVPWLAALFRFATPPTAVALAAVAVGAAAGFAVVLAPRLLGGRRPLPATSTPAP